MKYQVGDKVMISESPVGATWISLMDTYCGRKGFIREEACGFSGEFYRVNTETGEKLPFIWEAEQLELVEDKFNVAGKKEVQSLFKR